MRAGSLNTRALLQRLATGTDDEQGAESGVRFITIDTISVGLRLLRGQELMQHQRRAGVNMYEVTMRHREDVKSSMRLVVGQMVLDIVSPAMDPDNRHRFILVQAEVSEGE